MIPIVKATIKAVPRTGRLPWWLLIGTVLLTGTSHAADDVALFRDLAATLLLLNLPCSQVISARRVGEKASDQLVTCKGGLRYHVFVDANERVVARKQ